MNYHDIGIESSNKDRIILNESALLPRFSQDAYLSCRKADGERVFAAIQRLSTGESAQNLLIYGPSGSGKTAMAKWAINKMEEQTRRVLCIYANCWRYNTSMAIYAKIADAFGEPVSRRGRASDEVFDRIIELMRESKKPILLVLDQIDALIRYDNGRILHNIASVDEDRVLFEVIGISENENALSRLPERTKEILGFAKIQVQSFSREELLALVKERALVGLREGTYDDSVLEEIVDIGAAEKGSGRFALQLLWRAARGSEDAGYASISKTEVEKIRQDLEFVEFDFSREERIILDLLKNGQITSSELYSQFWQRIPRGKRQIRNYLKQMEKNGYIEIEEFMGSTRFMSKKIKIREGFRWRRD